VIAYCGAGISATVDIFVLSILGRETFACMTDRLPSGAQTRIFRWMWADRLPEAVEDRLPGHFQLAPPG